MIAARRPRAAAQRPRRATKPPRLSSRARYSSSGRFGGRLNVPIYVDRGAGAAFDHIRSHFGPGCPGRKNHESTSPLSALGFNGGQGVNRTLDTRIFSPLLYRLSYLPTVFARADQHERSFVPMIAAPCNAPLIA
jgi:hypothetical protein